MKKYMRERARALGEYIVATGDTVRGAGEKFGISKSTVHKDVTERLESVDEVLSRRVKEVLSKNLSERHLRGGDATRRKYEHEKQTIEQEKQST